MDIVLVHGYNVTSTRTYGELPQRLKAAGHNIKNVYLAKYVTLDNDLTLDDIVRAFDAALKDVYPPSRKQPKFACITHSTGGLVLRAWIAQKFSGRHRQIPISHLIMLAGPNHGSRLATLGQSRLSRLRSLWGVEPGLKILEALEIGSAYQRNVNIAWLQEGFHNAAGFFPVAIAGEWIDKKLWDVLVPATYERGSDGVVRVPSANPNMRRFVIDESGVLKKDFLEGIPFLVTPKTSHSDESYGIMGSIPSRGDHPVYSAIEQTLAIQDRKAYQALALDFEKKTTELQQEDTYYDRSHLDRYCQVVVHVTDKTGNPIGDHALELLDGRGRGDQLPSGFLAHTHPNSHSPEIFTFFLDFDQISKVEGKRLGLQAQSTPHSPLVTYKTLRFEGTAAQVFDVVRPNQTTYLDVILVRRLNRNVFQLTKNLGYQKIDRKPSEDWIDN